MGHATGNPVFDFRANFRRIAGYIQSFLILGAFILVGGALHAYYEQLKYGAPSSDNFIHTYRVAFLMLEAVLLLICSFIWGFWWRNRVRAEFRQKFQ